MGPDNPWSPNWRPDPSGRRLAAIRVARRGAVLAAAAYLGVGAVVVAVSELPDQIALFGLLVGLPGVALLGAGLANAALGPWIDAVVTGVAFAIGAPVAAVTSIVIGALIIDALFPGPNLAGPIVQRSVLTAVGLAPVVALAAVGWVLAVRRLARMPTRSTSTDVT
jgi:hypothetical protein